MMIMFKELAKILVFFNPWHIQQISNQGILDQIYKVLQEEPTQFEEMSTLLKKYSQAELFKTDDKKRTILHFLLLKKDVPIYLVNQLLLHREFANMQDKFNRTPLHIAIKKKHVEAAMKLIDITDCSLKNKAQQTPLDIAFDMGQEKVFMSIFKKHSQLETPCTYRTFDIFENRAGTDKLKKSLLIPLVILNF